MRAAYDEFPTLGTLTVGTPPETLRICHARYGNNDRLAILLLDRDGARYATVSINVYLDASRAPSAAEADYCYDLAADEFVLNHDLSPSLVAALERTSLFLDTGKRVDYGYVTGQPIWKVA